MSTDYLGGLFRDRLIIRENKMCIISYKMFSFPATYVLIFVDKLILRVKNLMSDSLKC